MFRSSAVYALYTINRSYGSFRLDRRRILPRYFKGLFHYITMLLTRIVFLGRYTYIPYIHIRICARTRLCICGFSRQRYFILSLLIRSAFATDRTRERDGRTAWGSVQSGCFSHPGDLYFQLLSTRTEHRRPCILLRPTQSTYRTHAHRAIAYFFQPRKSSHTTVIYIYTWVYTCR